MDKVYLATYSFGFDNRMSDEEKLKAAEEMGYSGVEFFGDFRKTPAPEMKALLDKYHLEGLSAHVGMDKMEEAIPYMAEIGAKMVICPGFPFANEEEAKHLAGLLNKAGEVGAKYGIKVGYHNHTSEFFVDGGKPILDYVIENTDKDNVVFEIDCGWASAAGIDPIEYINQHAGRVYAIHVKENSKVLGIDTPKSMNAPKQHHEPKIDENGNYIIPDEIRKMMEERMKVNVPTGTGMIDWKAVKAAADAQGCIAYIVEREYSYNEPQDRVACLREDCAYLKNNI